MSYRYGTVLLLGVFSAGCSTIRETQPPRTATEQLLISAAADRAAGELRLPLPLHSKVYVDAGNLDGTFDIKYALSAIRAGLLRQGLCLVSKEEADTVLEIRTGALSINQTAQLWLGVPSFKFPVPFFGAVTIPEIPLLKNELQEGIAKFAVTAYGAKDGTLRKLIGPVYGISRVQKYVVLSVPWTDSDILPPAFDDKLLVK